MEPLEAGVGLEGEDRSGEDRRQEDDWEPLDADPDDLSRHGATVERPTKEPADRQRHELDAAAVELQRSEREAPEGDKEAHWPADRRLYSTAVDSRDHCPGDDARHVRAGRSEVPSS